MAECQNNSFKSKSPKEDDDMSEAHTSLDDAREPEPNDPNMAKQTENDQTSGGQQKKDRHVANSSRTESHLEQRAESEKSNNAENSKVESSREPQEKNSRTSGTVPGKNDQKGKEHNQWNRSQAESKQWKHDHFESGYDSQRISGRDHGAAEIGKDSRTVTDPGKSYSEALKKNIIHNNGPTKVHFYLLILGEHSVDQAFIHLGPGEIKQLALVKRRYNLWGYSATLPRDPIKDGLKYKYRFIEKGDNSMFTFLSRLGISSNDPTCYEEPTDRPVKAHTQFDVFHFPHDKHYLSETEPKAILSYLKLLLPCVIPSTISELLNQIESLQFIACETKHVKEYVSWIEEDALDPSRSDEQRLYLCITLGHLKNSSSSLPFSKDNKTAKACDLLLQCLNACVDSNFLSKSNVECLKKIAISLVENSSSPGWLTLAAHFYPYLGIEFVLAVKDTRELINYRCEGDEYKKMVGALLSHIKKKDGNDLVAHKYLLDSVLKHAPTLDDALELFESVDFRWFFTNEDEKVDFFVNYYQDKMQCTNAQEKTVGAKLIEFNKIPKKMRGRMNKYLFSTLLEFSTSDDELSGEHTEIFLKSIISRKYLDENQVFDVLMALSKSKIVACQNLLLKVLGNDLFGKHWRDASLQRKVEICKSWVITRVANKSCANSLGGVDKIVAVYEAVDAIVQCSLNDGNKTLAEDLCSFVVERFLSNEDVVSVLKACASIEKCLAVVQDCYKSHVRIKLRQAPRMVNKASLFLQEFPNSSLGQDLLLCIVDIIVSEIATESENDESNFRKILDWCDIWIVLLTTTGLTVWSCLRS